MRFQTTVLLLLIHLSLSAQYYELGAFLGVTNYKGELNLQSPLVPTDFNSAVGMFARYNFNRHFSTKASLLKGQVSGSDINANKPELRERNLSFRSDIVELAVVGEYYLLPFAIREGKITAPYLFAGIAGYRFNPQAEVRGNWYELQPVGTEGQGDPRLSDDPKYSRYQSSIPLGIGFKFSLNHSINIGVEFGARKTFTDYLDDVSGVYPDLDILYKENPMAAMLSFRTPEYNREASWTNPKGQPRGNPSDKDWYFFTGISVSVNMTDKYGLDFDPKYDVFKNPVIHPFKMQQKEKREGGRQSKTNKK